MKRLKLLQHEWRVYVLQCVPVAMWVEGVHVATWVDGVNVAMWFASCQRVCCNVSGGGYVGTLVEGNVG